MRGEHHVHLSRRLPHDGLSPHARGTYVGQIDCRAGYRFIPACAGNISADGKPTAVYPVYPRMRGEHVDLPIWPISAHGLSPHARGTCTAIALVTTAIRFIPACAGNMLGITPERAKEFGLSPHARGTFMHSLKKLRYWRFIPACAGNILADRIPSSMMTVYPRMRGEHVCLVVTKRIVEGLSPHARGTLLRIHSLSLSCRFIPACAGNILLMISIQDNELEEPRKSTEFMS